MASNTGQVRNNPFSRNQSPSPAPSSSNGRPKSMVLNSPLSSSQSPANTHNRYQSYASLAGVVSPNQNGATRFRSNSRGGGVTSNTFAPSFIETDEMRRGPEPVRGIEGENDFSGKRYVWLKDSQAAFVKGWIVEEMGNNQILVQCDDGCVC